MADRTSQWIEYLLSTYPGETADPAFEAAKDLRGQVDLGKSGFARDLDLRDAEHALFSQTNIDESPILGRLGVAMGVPAYSTLKVLAQNYPRVGQTLAPMVDPLLESKVGRGTSMESLKRSSPPDLSELYWGLRPLWSQVRKPKLKTPGLSTFAPQ